jgi:hypothetical protein
MESGGVLGREGAQAASLIHWPMVVAVQRQEVGLPKARQIGRDHVSGLRQLGPDLPKRSRGARKSVQKQHGGPGRLTCRDEGQLRAAGQTKSLPGRRAHFRAPLLDRLTSRNIHAEAIYQPVAQLAR